MGLTFSEKVISSKLGDEKKAGEFAFVPVSKIMANELSGFVSIKQFEKYGFCEVFDPDNIFLIPSHNVPTKDVTTSIHAKTLKDFAKKYNIKHYYELGEMGIEHALLPEKRLIYPGDLVVGGDSHTCTYGALGVFSVGMGSTDIAATLATGKTWLRVPETINIDINGSIQDYVTPKDIVLYMLSLLGVDGALYQTLEITGSVIDSLDIEGRLTICNMAVESGAKAGIMFVDDKTIKYYQQYGISKDEYEIIYSDQDATYSNKIELDVSGLSPVVAMPYSPSNVKSIDQLDDHEKVNIDQVVIGSCTNGRISDLRQAANILKNNKIANGVKAIIIPATQDIYLQAIKEGLVEIFIEAGAVFLSPTCGPCAGLHSGVLGPNEIAVSTTNRNFPGRMGHIDSKVYLASPYVAAASALKGYIASPLEVI